ncbi:MAG: lipocalin family protein [Algicola sp.]|nr:lipocalin family protein [Algicola sp.]
MKTLIKLCSICLLVVTYNCSSDDGDNGSTNPTVQELLVSGKWYNESRSVGSNYSDCEKNGSIAFNNNGQVMVETFDDPSGPCESLGLITATYTLANSSEITIIYGSEVLISNIVTITQESLTIMTSDGESLTFDKTQG